MSRDNPLWLQLWSDEQTAFHQDSVNTQLVRFWSEIIHTQGSRVFVPLCGKSLDMIWLAEQGHEVIGVELSPIAVAAFFEENNLSPVKKQVGDFTLWQAGNISILCGDYFSLHKTDLCHVDTVYDRAALTALPEDIRKRYVTQMRTIISTGASVFLLTIEDAGEDDSLLQALDVDTEVAELYQKYFTIKLTSVESVFEADPKQPGLQDKLVQYKVYLLSDLLL